MPRAYRTTIVLAALACVGALIAGALLTPAPTRRHVRLDNGTVWIASSTARKAARLNVRLRQADATVPLSSPSPDVAQHGPATVLLDGTQAIGVDPATTDTGRPTTVGERSQVHVAGGTLAVLDEKSGDVRIGVADDMDSLDGPSSPRFRLGRGGLVCVTYDGRVHGLRPADGAVLVLDGPQDREPATEAVFSDLGGRTPDGFAVVGDVPVVLSGATVRWPRGRATLDGRGPFAIQRAPVDDGQRGWVALAGQGTLDLLDLTDAAPIPVRLTSGGSGRAATPVSSSGCVFAAWSQRQDNHLRVCAPEASGTAFETLDDVNGGSRLVFRTNHRLVVLNDIADGDAWDMDEPDETIRLPWRNTGDDRVEEQSSQEMASRTSDRMRAECSPQSGAIDAVDDSFSVRAGERRLLHVLRNDRQTDCSVLRVVSVRQPHGGLRVAATGDGRALQIDASQAQTGDASFSYAIDDGRGQETSATVTLSVLPDGGNRPPVQSAEPTSLDVERGGRLSIDVLDGFDDPDGDVLSLIDASVAGAPGVTVSTRPDGLLTVDATRAEVGRAQVTLSVRDGSGAACDGVAHLEVHPSGTLGASMDPMSRQLVVGTPATLDLEPYIHGSSSAAVHVRSLGQARGVRVERHGDAPSFTVEASSPGTHYLPVTLSQGALSTTGLVRLDAHAALPGTGPTAVDDVAWLDDGGNALVSPLDNDTDPTGGVLTLTEVRADPKLGLKTGIVDGSRVVLSSPHELREPVSLSYEATGAAGKDRGVITVHPAPPVSVRPLDAPDMTLRVRAGGIVSADVMDALDETTRPHARLVPELGFDEAEDTADDAGRQNRHGLAFVSDGKIRYQAPEAAGTTKVRYRIEDDSGNRAEGTVTFDVHERDATGKRAPSPRGVEARAAAGSTVRIPIPLEGIDPDGDDLQLLGLGNASPRLGRIVAVEADALVYEAFPDSKGTDVFSYAVEDWSGRRAQARVAVGIVPRSRTTGVVARDDRMTIRPGVEVTAPVTDNDLTGGQGEPWVLGEFETEGIDSRSVRAENGSVTFVAPREEGTVAIVHTVEDEAGFRDSATLTATVDPQARIEPPKARDHRVPATSTIDAASVDVDVSAWMANPSGPADGLRVDVHPSASRHAWRKGGPRSTVITIELTDRARAVPYTVTNTEHGLVSMAFLHVPAFGVFPPVPRTGAPELKVRAGASIDIPLADHVRVGAGKHPRIDDPGTLGATKASAASVSDDGMTLRYTARDDASGPASITFEASDGWRQTGGDGARSGDAVRLLNTAMLTLPITIIGDGPSMPSFVSGSIEVAAGEEPVGIDLRALTEPPSAGGASLSGYRYSGGLSSAGVTAEVSRTGRMTVRAEESAAPDTTLMAPVSIDYGGGVLEAGMTVRVTATNRPLARLHARSVRVVEGETARIDMLSDAFNPFPGTPLRLVSATVAGGDALSATVEGNGVLAIAVARGSGALQGAVRVTARDATGMSSREVSATVTVSTVAAPDAPMLSAASRHDGDGAVRLGWLPGKANGSPILEYQVSWNGASSGSLGCGTAVSCIVPGLANGQRYEFTVRARNEVGWSASSNALEATPDRAPTAPGAVTLTGGLRRATVRWTAPRYDGSPPLSYVVTLRGPGDWSATATVRDALSAVFENIPDDVLELGTSFTATVRARNAVGDGPDSAPSAPALVEREEPRNEAIPESPGKPGTPTKPVVPDGSGDSGDKDGPSDPIPPDQPKDPDPPENPDPPEDKEPTEPEQPEPPTEPEQPEQPEPDPPTDPEPPTEPEQPGQPEQPEPPTEPEPEQPTNPKESDAEAPAIQKTVIPTRKGAVI